MSLLCKHRRCTGCACRDFDGGSVFLSPCSGAYQQGLSKKNNGCLFLVVFMLRYTSLPSIAQDRVSGMA